MHGLTLFSFFPWLLLVLHHCCLQVEVTGIFRAQPRRISTKLTKVKSVYKTYIDVIHYRESVKQVTSAKKMRTTTTSVNALSGLSPERIQQIKDVGARDDIYNVLTDALAPSIWELDNVKRGVLCMLFGGNSRRIQRGLDGGTSSIRNKEGGDDTFSDCGDEMVNEDDQLETNEQPLNKRGDINILLCGGKVFDSFCCTPLFVPYSCLKLKYILPLIC